MRWRCAGLLPLLLVLVIPGVPARAHSQRSPGAGSPDSIVIPNLTHGQMAVIAGYRTAVLDLTDRLVQMDRTTQRLVGFINVQFSACLWGLVPGSILDEASPFNECTHAYLAGVQALLLHLRKTRPADAAVQMLADQVELTMLARSAALVLCQYSSEGFSTGDIIGPHWSDIPTHPPTIAMAGGLMVVGVVPVRWGRRRRQRAR